MRRLLFLVLLVLPVTEQGQGDYLRYHALINHAEETYFLRGQYDSAKTIYTQVFDEYSFCFLRDCFIAAQVAAVHKDWPACVRFIEEGFENGMQWRDLDSLERRAMEVTRYVQVFQPLLSDAA